MSAEIVTEEVKVAMEKLEVKEDAENQEPVVDHAEPSADAKKKNKKKKKKAAAAGKEGGEEGGEVETAEKEVLGTVDNNTEVPDSVVGF
jgi:hypothetical protein